MADIRKFKIPKMSQPEMDLQLSLQPNGTSPLDLAHKPGPMDQTVAPCPYCRLTHFSQSLYCSRYSRRIFAMARASKTQESSSESSLDSESSSDSSESESSDEGDVVADAYGPSCSKSELAAAYSSKKRADEKETTMALSPATLNLYFKTM